jgi:Na+/proline symporter
MRFGVAPFSARFRPILMTSGLTKTDLMGGRLDTALGAILAAAAAVATVVVTSTLFAANADVSKLNDGADFATALQPLIGSTGATLFALGIVEAGLAAAMTISTSSAYAMCETIQRRHSLNLEFSQGRWFYAITMISTLIADGVVLIPGAPLVALPGHSARVAALSANQTPTAITRCPHGWRQSATSTWNTIGNTRRKCSSRLHETTARDWRRARRRTPIRG